MSSPKTDVAIIGSGPYGLSLASHLRSAGISHRVFGEPMSYWMEYMPRGMVLRSSWDASHIASPDPALRLDAYQAELGRTIPRPIPLDTFVDYGKWFQSKVVGEPDRRQVMCVEPEEGSFRLSLDDGERLIAKRVAVATGLQSFARVPAPFSDLPPSLCVHTSTLTDPASLQGRRAAVVGGGQSALETAALLREAGADVEVLVREDHVHWLARSLKLHQKDGFMGRLLYPPTDVGPPGLNQIVSRPNLWRRLPSGLGARIAYRSIRPAGAGWLVPRLKDVPIRLSADVDSVQANGHSVSLKLRDGTRKEYDSIVLGTGFQIDARKYSFISRDILSKLSVNAGYPTLTRGFESSVPGLHFVGAVAAMSFGPVMRFVSGTTFTAREFTSSIVNGRG